MDNCYSCQFPCNEFGDAHNLYINNNNKLKTLSLDDKVILIDGESKEAVPMQKLLSRGTENVVCNII